MKKEKDYKWHKKKERKIDKKQMKKDANLVKVRIAIHMIGILYST